MTGNGIKFVEWMFNGTGIRQDQNGISVATGNHVLTEMIATLTISRYNSVLHLGTYELLATNQAGRAVVASWLLRDAGMMSIDNNYYSISCMIEFEILRLYYFGYEAIIESLIGDLWYSYCGWRDSEAQSVCRYKHTVKNYTGLQLTWDIQLRGGNFYSLNCCGDLFSMSNIKSIHC